MKIQKTKCNQCLFTKNRITPTKRAEEVIRDCLKRDKYFICHKAQFKDSDVCCRGFWDNYKNNFNSGRIAQRLNVIKEVIIE